MSNENYEVVAKSILINSEGDMLAMRRHPKSRNRPNEWDFPGGKVEKGEDVIAGAVREIEEETGLIVSPNALTELSKVDNDEEKRTRIFYVARASGKVTIGSGEEHSEYRWMSPDQALREFTYLPQNQAIQTAIDARYFPAPLH